MILIQYLTSPPNFSGFDDVPTAKRVATLMYEGGADVIFHASGTSGLGLFEAATAFTVSTGDQVWAIGVDTDQYETVALLPGATEAAAWQAHILTSALKGIDTRTYDLLAAYARHEFRSGEWSQGLTATASGISYSGGYLDDLRPTLDQIKARIIAGTIVVPCLPTDRIEIAATLGLTPDNCHVATR